jgi:ArsR family transcriptional regulator
MDSVAGEFRLLSDPARLRALRVLARQELSAGEVAQVLAVAPSSASKQLAALRDAGLVEERRDGRHVFFRVPAAARTDARWAPAFARVAEAEDAAGDLPRLDDVLRARRESQAEGDGARQFVPGRSWAAWARALTLLAPPGLRVLDVGCGDGALALELSRFASEVVGIDRREAAIRAARARAERRASARATGTRRRAPPAAPQVTFAVADAEAPGLPDASFDLAVFSQVLNAVADPARALAAAHAALVPGGKVLVLDLLAHREAWVRERLGHRRLGFGPADLASLLRGAGFADVRVERVAGRGGEPFKVLLASGVRAPVAPSAAPSSESRLQPGRSSSRRRSDGPPEGGTPNQARPARRARRGDDR